MTKAKNFQRVSIFTAGLLLGLMIPGLRHIVLPKTVAAQDVAKSAAPDLAAMQADIAHLKDVVPSQSHTMTDVGYQFANLWFAGKHSYSYRYKFPNIVWRHNSDIGRCKC